MDVYKVNVIVKVCFWGSGRGFVCDGGSMGWRDRSVYGKLVG